MKHSSIGKRAALCLLLLTALAVLSACYMEPDRVVDADNGLTVDNGGQSFDTVITPTPVVTATPTPAPTTNEVDWSSWNFGNDTATNPPSNVQPTTATGQTTGGVSAPTTVPTVHAATVAATSSTPTPRPNTNTSGSSATTSSTSLKSGSKGSDVKRLQQRLKDLG